MQLPFMPVRPLVYLMVYLGIVLTCHGRTGIFYPGPDNAHAFSRDGAASTAAPPEPAAVSVWLPAVPASAPLIMALLTQPWAKIQIFTNHSRAHALFLRGEIPLLATGLSIGKGFFDRGAPVRMINGYVTGMTWLVADRPVRDMADLAGLTLVLPFEGSPIEEVTRVFIREARLNRDIPIQYRTFQSSVTLMGTGRIHAAALPEPYATMVTDLTGNWTAVSYKDLWERYTGEARGYPQVGVFAQSAWTGRHPDLIQGLNRAMVKTISDIRSDPEGTAALMATVLHFSPELIRTALARTEFRLMTGKALAAEVSAYYRTVGIPLAKNFEDFF